MVGKGTDHINFSMFMALKGFHLTLILTTKVVLHKMLLAPNIIIPVPSQGHLEGTGESTLAESTHSRIVGGIETKTTSTAGILRMVPQSKKDWQAICKGMCQHQPRGQAHFQTVTLWGLI